MIDELVNVERRNDCAWVTINRPPLNLLEPGIIDSITDAFTKLGAEESVRAAVLGGAGAHMSAGMQIQEMRDLTSSSAEALITRLRDAIDSVFNAPFPTIAMVQGACLGGGFELVLACDMRILASDARLGLPEVRLGIPSVIHAALLPHTVGPSRAAQLLFTGKTIDAETALSWGIANTVVDSDQLESATGQLVDEILACGPRAIRLQKELLGQWRGSGLRDAIDLGISAFGRAFDSDEPRRAMQAFVEKRPLGLN